jgi:putative ABC transport system substrate-binding protein
MKKLISILLLSVLLLTGCSNGAESTTETSEPTEEITKTIGVLQLMDHTSLNLIYDSFYQQITKLGYTDDQIVFLNANGDMVNIENAVNQLKADQVDIAVAITTPCAQYAVALTENTPVVFSAVTDPVAAELVTSLTQTDKNITGTSDVLQINLIMDLALEFNPDAKTVGYIYNPGEINSVSNFEKLKEYCAENGLEIEDATISTSADLQTATSVIASKVDFIFVANDNTVAEAMQVVANEAIKAGIQVFTGADSMVMDGGFATVGIDYADLGIETANMVDAILNGTPVSDIPVKVFDTDLFIYVNTDTAAALGVEIPESILNNEKYIAISNK